MDTGVSGRKIAFLAIDGVAEQELSQPWDALSGAGAVPHLVSLHPGEIQAVRDDAPASRFRVDRVVTEIRAGEYDGLVLPGGIASADRLRMNADAVSFVRAFMDADKPVAAIAHGPWMLVEADRVRGRSLTSWPSLRTDIQNAGGIWVDRPVETDQQLVTTRGPADLPAFSKKLLTLFARAIDDRRLDSVVEQSFPASDPPPGPGATA